MDNKVKYTRSDIFNEIPVIHCFTTRVGGFSKNPFNTGNMHYKRGDNSEDVIKNRKSLFDDLKIDLKKLFLSNQVHSGEVLCIDDMDEKSIENMNVDGLITTIPGKVVGVYICDCLPVLIGVKNGVGALHAGWRGITKNILKNGIAKLIEKTDAKVENIKVAIGPGIKDCCFEVGSEVAEIFNNMKLEEFVKAGKKNKFLIDLSGSTKELLLREGIKEKNIHTNTKCTFCDKINYFSYRREGWPTGQMLGIISLK
jgi:purine-nucleoside/S-methyl-5'-thioadenosine phosphorylase / adenosine deaminase